MKKAVVLLNMGGARDKKELKELLLNMFLDKRIINSPIRFFLAPFMRIFRAKSAWKNYEKIGGSDIYKHTESLAKKVQKLLGSEYELFYAMRYTKPNISEIFQNKEFKEAIFFALYPQNSSTTTLSSYDEVDKFFRNRDTKIVKIGHFYEDEEFNKTIINSIKSKFCENLHLIFSAHGLPVSIAKKDPYEKQVSLHIEILKEMLEKEGLKFKNISLAYQSKIGPVEWLKPALDESLKKFKKGDNILVYPISFVIDNSETDFELSIEYKDLADKLGLNYSVCKAQNDSDEFALYLAKKIKSIHV